MVCWKRQRLQIHTRSCNSIYWNKLVNARNAWIVSDTGFTCHDRLELWRPQAFASSYGLEKLSSTKHQGGVCNALQPLLRRPGQCWHLWLLQTFTPCGHFQNHNKLVCQAGLRIGNQTLAHRSWKAVVRHSHSDKADLLMWGNDIRVKIHHWIPTARALAHPKVKAFVSHCGGAALKEWHSTPDGHRHPESFLALSCTAFKAACVLSKSEAEFCKQSQSLLSGQCDAQATLPQSPWHWVCLWLAIRSLVSGAQKDANRHARLFEANWWVLQMSKNEWVWIKLGLTLFDLCFIFLVQTRHRLG